MRTVSLNAQNQFAAAPYKQLIKMKKMKVNASFKGAIIGVSGKIGSGKTTVTQYLIDNLRYEFVERSFAYKVKQIASILCGLPMEDMISQEGKNKRLEAFGGITVGELQQIIGTDMFRQKFSEDVWITSLFLDYKPDEYWIVSDVRFKNEADYIRKIGGTLIRLEGDPAGVRAASNRNLNHPSETDLDDYEHFDIVMETSSNELGTLKLKMLATVVANVIVNPSIYKNGDKPFIKF